MARDNADARVVGSWTLFQNRYASGEENRLGRHDELIQRAAELGRAIASHETAKEFREAQRAVRDSVDSQRLLNDYTRQAEHVRRLEADRRPIEVSDKRNLADAEEKMASDAAMKIPSPISIRRRRPNMSPRRPPATIPMA